MQGTWWNTSPHNWNFEPSPVYYILRLRNCLKFEPINVGKKTIQQHYKDHKNNKKLATLKALNIGKQITINAKGVVYYTKMYNFSFIQNHHSFVNILLFYSFMFFFYYKFSLKFFLLFSLFSYHFISGFSIKFEIIKTNILTTN